MDDLRKLNGISIVTSPALSVTLNLMLQDGDTNLLASPRIRARNREKAKIMIGDRVPVITNAVTPVSTGSPVVTGNVQYLDVGLKLEVEPDIHLDNEVAIKIGLEVSSIVKEVPNAVSGTLAYQVGTRNATTVLRLKDGETQILAGLISDEDRNSASKVPGLGQLPLLGRLFSSHKDDTERPKSFFRSRRALSASAASRTRAKWNSGPAPRPACAVPLALTAGHGRGQSRVARPAHAHSRRAAPRAAAPARRLAAVPASGAFLARAQSGQSGRQDQPDAQHSIVTGGWQPGFSGGI